VIGYMRCSATDSDSVDDNTCETPFIRLGSVTAWNKTLSSATDDPSHMNP
jgi:hypothetical protein